MTAPRLALLALLLVATPGCMGYRTGRPEDIASRSLHPRGRLDRPAAVQWRQVLIGTPRPTLRGYIRSTDHVLDAASHDTGTSHMIYDRDFRLVGRCSPCGETYRIDARGDERSEGNLPLDLACLLLLEATRTDIVQMIEMPRPRS